MEARLTKQHSIPDHSSNQRSEQESWQETCAPYRLVKVTQGPGQRGVGPKAATEQLPSYPGANCLNVIQGIRHLEIRVMDLSTRGV